mgnify:CR=1 FL=1
MAEVKWIKITTDMFDDEKIDYIQSLPEGDSILIIWIRFLTMAGKCNESGKIFLTESIPYTVDALSHKFKKPETIIKLALKTFSNLGMIQVYDDGVIFISNFSKYQNMEGLEKIKQREYEKLKKRKQRQKLKELEPNNVKNNNVPGTVPGQSPGTPSTVDKEREEERDKDKELDKERETKEKDLSLGTTEILNFIEEKTCVSLSSQYQNVSEMVETYDVEHIKKAISKSLSKGKKGKNLLDYANGILKNWAIERKEEQNNNGENKSSEPPKHREGLDESGIGFHF